MKVNALAPWYGSNRMLAHRVGELLEGCSWVGVPFAGSLAEVPHITARSIVVNDLHRDIINLAMVTAHPVMGPKLYRHLRRLPFHPHALADARGIVDQDWTSWEMPNFNRALGYFVSCWMNRSALAGTDGEFRGGLPVRWSATGGDSAVRYRSAVHSLIEWRRVLAKCNFTCLDVFEFLGKCLDAPTSGIYLDPPFPTVGEKYRHKMTEEQHCDLAAVLCDKFQQTRIVCRFYDHPLVRKLYHPDFGWHWLHIAGGRTQANETAPEVLLVRNHLKFPAQNSINTDTTEEANTTE